MSSLCEKMSELLQFLWVILRQNLIFFENLEFWYLAQFYRFLPNFLYLSAIPKYVQLIYTSMGPKTIPS